MRPCPCCAGEKDPGANAWKLYLRLCDRCYADFVEMRDCTAPHVQVDDEVLRELGMAG